MIVINEVTENSLVEEVREEPVADETILEEPKKKERIVPFNVLMLKSDKEKIKRREQQAIQLEQPEIKQEVVFGRTYFRSK